MSGWRALNFPTIASLGSTATTSRFGCCARILRAAGRACGALQSAREDILHPEKASTPLLQVQLLVLLKAPFGMAILGVMPGMRIEGRMTCWNANLVNLPVPAARSNIRLRPVSSPASLSA